MGKPSSACLILLGDGWLANNFRPTVEKWNAMAQEFIQSVTTIIQLMGYMFWHQPQEWMIPTMDCGLGHLINTVVEKSQANDWY